MIALTNVPFSAIIVLVREGEGGDMKVKIAERHAPLSDALRAYVLEKAKSLERYYNRIISIDVVLSVEKERQIASMHAHLTNRKIIHAHEKSSDMYASIDKAIDKLQRQLVKYKDQLKDKGGISLPKATAGTATSAEVDHKDIIRSDIYFYKPMSPDEASLQLEALEKDFLVFIDADTDEVSIIYHRSDGNYGLITPKR